MKIYRLRFPSDGKIQGEIRRFPIGLPVKLKKKLPDRYVCIEPKGETVEFPLTPVWLLGDRADIFEIGKSQMHEPYLVPPLLEGFASEEEAQREWYRWSHPEKFRWYIDELRSFVYARKRVYSDWEMFFDEETMNKVVRAVLLHMKELHSLFKREYPRRFFDAIADIALHQTLSLIDENLGDGVLDDEELLQITVITVIDTVFEMLRHDYYVMTEGQWDFEKGTFKHRTFEVKL